MTLPLRESIRWALGPDFSHEAVRRFHEWNVDALLTSGLVFVDAGITSVVGGRYDPIGMSGRLRYAVLSPSRKGKRYGRFRLPDIPTASRERLVAVTRQAMAMRPHGRVQLLQLWGSSVATDALASVARPLLKDEGRKAAAFAATAEGDEVANGQLEVLGLRVFESVDTDPEGLGTLLGWTVAAGGGP